MIQRKQTIFLLLALIATVVCLLSRIGHFEPVGMGTDAIMYNMYVRGAKEGMMVFPLMVVLLLTCPLILWAVFAYKNRKFQARLCLWTAFLDVVWYALYAVYGYVIGMENTTFHIEQPVILPFLSIIMLLLARRGILADERLVRAADRIR